MTFTLLRPLAPALLCTLGLLHAAQAPAQMPPPADAASIARTTAAVDAAPPIQLRLSYHSSTIGNDGVQRDTRYANRMVRRAGRVWIERDMPAVLRARLGELLVTDLDPLDTTSPSHGSEIPDA